MAFSKLVCMMDVNWSLWVDTGRCQIGAAAASQLAVTDEACELARPARGPPTPVNQWDLDELQACDVTVAPVGHWQPRAFRWAAGVHLSTRLGSFFLWASLFPINHPPTTLFCSPRSQSRTRQTPIPLASHTSWGSCLVFLLLVCFVLLLSCDFAGIGERAFELSGQGKVRGARDVGRR